MSDWILENDYKKEVPSKQSDWMLAPASSSSEQSKGTNESLGSAVLKAPFRIKEDLYKGVFNLMKNSPHYYNTIKSGLPAAYQSIIDNPKGAMKQATAGLAELGQNVFNSPHDAVNYFSNRLNLIPQSINEKVQMGRMPSDTEQMINKTFGEPRDQGEEFLRGVTRNSANILSMGVGAGALNPLKLTNKGIANNVVKEQMNQISKHSKKYDALWEDAEKTGFNNVPYDRQLLNPYTKLIEKFYPEKSTLVLKDFMENPTLENAQKAQSDLGNLRRSLEEKARSTPLLETEKYLHEALSKSEKNIESNMFKNSNGDINEGLANRYNKISKSYRKNVVPYRYNSDIQAFINKELTAKELVERLGKGEFAAKKLSKHRAISIRQLLGPATTGAGLLGGSAWLYNDIFNNNGNKDTKPYK